MYQYEIWASEPNYESLRQHLHFFIYCILVYTTWGPKIEPQHLHFNFLFVFLFIFLSMGLRGCGIKPPQPHFILIFFFEVSLPWLRGCGFEPPASL